MCSVLLGLGLTHFGVTIKWISTIEYVYMIVFLYMNTHVYVLMIKLFIHTKASCISSTYTSRKPSKHHTGLSYVNYINKSNIIVNLFLYMNAPIFK